MLVSLFSSFFFSLISNPHRKLSPASTQTRFVYLSDLFFLIQEYPNLGAAFFGLSFSTLFRSLQIRHSSPRFQVLSISTMAFCFSILRLNLWIFWYNLGISLLWVLVDDLIHEILIHITQNNNTRLFKVLERIGTSVFWSKPGKLWILINLIFLYCNFVVVYPIVRYQFWLAIYWLCACD